jgi:hypothetical protein
MPVQRIKLAILPLDVSFSGLVIHSGEILATDKSHKKQIDGLTQDWDLKSYYELYMQCVMLEA